MIIAVTPMTHTTSEKTIATSTIYIATKSDLHQITSMVSLMNAVVHALDLLATTQMSVAALAHAPILDMAMVGRTISVAPIETIATIVDEGNGLVVIVTTDLVKEDSMITMSGDQTMNEDGMARDTQGRVVVNQL